MGLSSYTAYRDTNIKTAGPGQLVVMLYDAAIKQCDIAIKAFENQSKPKPNRIEEINKALIKVQDIITELSTGLNFENGGEIVTDLFSLYSWFLKEILDANIKKDLNKIITVKKQLVELSEAWVNANKQNSKQNIGPQSIGGEINIAG